jgi:serine/threonine-protein kinase
MVILTWLDPETKTPLQTWELEIPTIRVGRAADNQVVINDPLVSRYHLELHFTAPDATQDQSGSGWQVTNRSSNGTFLDGYLVTRSPLPIKGQLRLAQTGPILQFQLQPVAPPVPPVRTPAAVPPQVALPQPVKSPVPAALPSIVIAKPLCHHGNNQAGNLFCIHCGQPLQIEKTVRQYRVLRSLASGGMGTTYLAWSPKATARLSSTRGTLLVLKEMNAEMAQIPKAQELFEREAAVLKTLHHPGIPKFHDFFVEQNKRYLVMELIHGQDLEQWVKQKGVVPLQKAVIWMIQTCGVLSYLHARPAPIIHRDIKPSNLLVRYRDNQIVIVDFGAVKASEQSTGTRIGAEGYSAPEQTQGRPVIQSDLYAVGTSLAFLLTGIPPSRFYQQQKGIYRLTLESAAMVPLPLRQVIERVTAPAVGDRYATATELAHALAACL